MEPKALTEIAGSANSQQPKIPAEPHSILGGPPITSRRPVQIRPSSSGWYIALKPASSRGLKGNVAKGGTNLNRELF